jgi:hypothetical protein
LRPTPLSPDFDPLASSRSSMPRHLVSAARYIRAAFRRKRRQVSRVARLRGPKAHATPRFRSVRPIRKPASLREPPYPTRRSASDIVACSTRSTRRLPELRLPTSDRSEDLLSVSNLLHPDRPKATRISHPTIGLARKPTRSPGRSSGPGAIIRRVSAFPATGGLTRSPCRSTPPCVRAISLQCPTGSLARSKPGSAGADVPTSKALSSPCGSDNNLEDQVLEQSADFSANRPRSRCHEAVTDSDSRQARNRLAVLWITWISCTAAGPAPEPAPPAKFARDATLRRAKTLRIRH